MKDTHLSNFYHKKKKQRGAKKAIVALARKLFVIIYNLIKNNDVYREEKFEITKQKQEELRLKRIIYEAQKMGYSLISNKEA
jgi:hypothetical protein